MRKAKTPKKKRRAPVSTTPDTSEPVGTTPVRNICPLTPPHLYEGASTFLLLCNFTFPKGREI